MQFDVYSVTIRTNREFATTMSGGLEAISGGGHEGWEAVPELATEGGGVGGGGVLHDARLLHRVARVGAGQVGAHRPERLPAQPAGEEDQLQVLSRVGQEELEPGTVRAGEGGEGGEGTWVEAVRWTTKGQSGQAQGV